MVDKKLIQETIIELLDANVDKDTIYATLKEIGVDEDQIETNYKEVLVNKEVKVENKPEKVESPIIEQKSTTKIINEPEIDDTEDDTEDDDEDDIFETKEAVAKKTTKTDFLENNKNRNEDILESELKKTTEDVDEINNSDSFIETKKDVLVSNNKQLDYMQDQITDIKAEIKGLTKIMKDILEENRKMLNKM